jgi:hypothetical protein
MRVLRPRVRGEPWPSISYREFESLSRRQLRRSRLFSVRECWQLSPLLAAISDLSSGLLIGRVRLFVSEWLISLQSSGLSGFGTVLEIRVFRGAYEIQMKWGSATPLGQAGASDFEIAISRFDSFRPSHPFPRSARLPKRRENGPEILAFRSFAFVSGLPLCRT